MGLFLGNEESGQKCAILYTIVENCRRLGIHPKEYLTDVLTRLPAMLAKDASTLTYHFRLQEAGKVSNATGSRLPSIALLQTKGKFEGLFIGTPRTGDAEIGCP